MLIDGRFAKGPVGVVDDINECICMDTRDGEWHSRIYSWICR